MKTNYTDEQIQSAIDAACRETHAKHRIDIGTNLVLDTKAMPETWKNEARVRRDLLKFALARLPEPTPAAGIARSCQFCGSTLLWSEERGAHCDGCDEYDEWLSEQTPPVWQPAVGDTVKLKSGGPVMVAETVRRDNAFCRWFDMNGVNGLHFQAACLVSAKEAQP
jgi:uncharacterized protein YodC (DUF2158 family)